MHTGVRVGVLFLMLASGAAERAAAQADSGYSSFWDHPLHVSTLVGISFPAGQWRNSFESGDYGAIAVAWPVRPASGIWLEGQFNGQSQLMTSTVQSGFQATGGGASIYSLTLNAMANQRDLLFGRVTPYIVGGGGWYYRHIELDEYAGTPSACSPFLGFCGAYGLPAVRTRAQNVLGWDFGGGLRLRLKSIWVVAETRYNSASTRYGPTRYLPVALGVSW